MNELIKIIICFIAVFILIPPASAQILDNEQEAFSQAKELNRPVLLIFSGSDWCIPCIRFRKEILSDSAFINYSANNLIILEADFPQKKKLSPEIITQNEKLAEKYNPQGLFPHLLILSPQGDMISTLWFDHQKPDEIIAQISKIIPSADGLKEFRTSVKLMGCGFEFTIVDSARSDGWGLIRQCIDEVTRIENLISEWIDTSEVSRLNAESGKAPVRVSPELYELIKRSKSISDITQGAFDISFLGAGNYWKFDREHPEMPDSSTIRKAISSVGYNNIILQDSSKVYLSKPGMKIGFGGIGQGYAAEKVKKMMVDKGITGGVINASGDIAAWGNRPDGSPWKVGIGDPSDPAKVLLWLPVRDGAISTSGDYENYFEIDGVHYGHIIDPRTGYPTKGVQSVTIIGPDAELADALATAVFVMGVATGIDLIEQLPGYDCIIIDSQNKIHYSEGVEILPGDKLNN